MDLAHSCNCIIMRVRVYIYVYICVIACICTVAELSCFTIAWKMSESFQEKCFQMKLYLLNGEYPEGFTGNEKRALRKRAHSFKICGDVLLYTCKERDVDLHEGQAPGPGGRTGRRVVESREEQLEILSEIHDNKLGGRYFCLK